ncbi:unnamed protein product [Cunninghamella blakesleeana]
MNNSLFSSHYDDGNNPWGTPNSFTATPQHDIERSYITPHVQSLTSSSVLNSHTNSHMGSNDFFNNSHNNNINNHSNNTNNNNITLSAASILSGVNVPEDYNSLYIEYQRSGRVSLTSLHKILSRANLSALDIEKIMQLVVPNDASYVTRSEFDTTLALIYCAQNHIDLSLNKLYQYRYNIGSPSLSSTQSNQTNGKVPNPLNDSSSISSPLTENERSNKMNGYSGTSLSPSHSNVTQQEQEFESTSLTKKKLDTRNWFKNIEEIKITIAPEREGFIFKHVNYIVESQKRSSIVLRRFSDFWWLMEVLIRRYPFRMLPNLPPKKLGGRDAAFLEKRRKGLSRFINAIVRHPVLRSDLVVTKFLTEPSELAAWRKQNPPSLEDEYKRKQHNIDEMRLIIPNNLIDQIQSTRSNVEASIKHYVNLCYIMERTIRRMHGQATDYVRYSIALNSLAESEHRYHSSECKNCQLVVSGYEKVAKHMQRESSILDNQVSLSADGVLENLKRVRDLLVSFRELIDRKDRIVTDNSETLAKRISANKTKLNQNNGVPGMESEVEKILEALKSDEQELKDQKLKQTFIQFCIWSEITYLHKQQALVSSLYRNYVKEMIEFSKLRTENWKELEGPVFEMPVEMDVFD